MAKKQDEAPFDLKSHMARSARAWKKRAPWDILYDEAYEYAIPYRKSTLKTGEAEKRVDRLFDNTALVSTFRFAGQLQQDLFPPGQPFFKLAPGPVAKASLSKTDVDNLTNQLEQVSNTVGAFFLTGEFDTAVNEMCVELAAGTAALLALEGDDRRPVRFVCLPMDEIAVEGGGYGDVAGIFWKTKMTARAIKEAFPNGTFPDDFKRKDNEPEEEWLIHQDFTRLPDGRWQFVAYLDKSEAPIVTETYRTQRVALPRYYRVPGEAYGRGPILLALPTIKTLNKAMELTLRAAAIQMLGIWGYRPGSFNPDTARLAPGQFWPMQATGGVLGADVTRLDPAAGRIDVSQIITAELRLQVQAALHDDRLPDKGATPVSATEIMARMKRIASNYLGAFGRLVNEIIPVVVRAVIDILYQRKLIAQDIDIDTLLIKVDVLSPIAVALKTEAWQKVVQFAELVAALKGGPQAIELILKLDDALREIGLEMGVPSHLLLTKEERELLQAQLAAAAAQLATAEQQAQQQEAAGPAA